ncbi:MAG: class I SAM-dependent methyltransferase [Rhodospirillaceae bacterium]
MATPVSRVDLKASACRFCGTPLNRTFADLGAAPPSNSYLRAADLRRSELYHPLHAYVCDSCHLVQLEEFETPERIFSDYAYFSSYSRSWLSHCEAYCRAMVARFGLDRSSQVIEIASNDGYLLKNFVPAGIRVLGVEPAVNVARVAMDRGIPTMVAFFGRETAKRLVGNGVKADLLVANNVMAHVPNLNDFVGGMKLVLAPKGVVTVEFPHLLNLIREVQFDTIYHEHFSYFSFMTANAVFAAHGMRLFDVEKLPTHGGSLRIYGCHADADMETHESVTALLEEERAGGLGDSAAYAGFEEKIRAVKRSLLRFLIDAQESGRSVAGYGAAAKGNTLLNYCGIGPELVEYVVDANPHKQGLYLPGSHIPVHAPERIGETRPDYILILPWNLQEEIVSANAHVAGWGGRFVVPIPEVRILP